MKHRSYAKKAAALIVSLGVIATSAMLPVSAAKPDDKAKAPAAEPVQEKAQTALPDAGTSALLTYKEYTKGHKDAVSGTDKVVIPADSFAETSSGTVLEIKDNYEGDTGKSVNFKDTGISTFNFEIKTAGLYTVKFNYYTGSASGSSAVRDVMFDGVVPFAESQEVNLPQLWTDESDEKRYDKLNNEVRAKQIQVGQWRSAYAEDVSGYVPGALQYYLTAGPHTISLDAERETLLLKSIEIAGVKDVPDYKDVIKQYKEKGYKNASAESTVTVQAEDPHSLRSEQTMYALNDRTSPSVEPYHVNLIRYNMVGGTNWEISGQWIEWKIDVKESGLYNIAAHFRQSLKTNDVSVREIYIDGELPFKEAMATYFYYDNAWQTTCLGSKDGTPFLFYFEKGEHTVKLRVGMGGASEFLGKAKSYLNDLNHIYRKIVMVTGVSPDTYRDYHLDVVIPDVLKDMAKTSKNLKALTKEVGEYNGQSGASTVALKRLYEQIDTIVDDPDTIASKLSSFQSNVASFGTWINDETVQPLELDYIMIKSPETKTPKGEVGFFKMLKHYVVQFGYSFVTDYEAVGIMEDEAESEITVWLITGRDQASIVKQMINDDFTPNEGVAANLQLVTAAALLPSILAGTGPDVYTGIAQAEPVNLALRDALVDLKQFDDFDEVAKRFEPEMVIPFTFNDGVYALPDTMDYYMLFTRTDILEEMGIPTEKLNDWDTILSDVLPVLQINSLAFGVPTAIHSYLTFLYQKGGTMYTPNGKKSNLSNDAAIKAMYDFTDLYTQYGFNLAYDFANRFRSGEMPIAVANLSSYNQLSVFAPDINGLWTMLMVPGTYDSNGKLDRSTVATVTGSVMMNDSKEKQAAWKYLKWWTSAEVQQKYGSELESVIGSAARYNTANTEAFGNIAWNRRMKQNLLAQRDWVKAFREVPGGYLTQRYYDFSFRYIVYDGDNVRDTMIDGVDSINREIAHKRAEYNLD